MTNECANWGVYPLEKVPRRSVGSAVTDVQNMHATLKSMTRIVTWLAWASFALRVMVPLGYMPAAIGDGGPFVLCPGGYQGALLEYLGSSMASNQSFHDHAGHASADHPSHHEGSDCSVGATFAAVAPIAAQPFVPPAPAVERPAAPADLPPAAALAPRYHSRAPPVSQLA